MGTWLGNIKKEFHSVYSKGKFLSPAPVLHPNPPALSLSELKSSTDDYEPNRVGEQGLGCISKYEPTDSLYIKLEQSVIPPGWSNGPIALHLDFYFYGKVAEENLTEELKTEYNMPNPLPIVVHGQDGLWLIDGGNGKFYLWQDVEGFVGEVYERNLAIERKKGKK